MTTLLHLGRALLPPAVGRAEDTALMNAGRALLVGVSDDWKERLIALNERVQIHDKTVTKEESAEPEVVEYKGRWAAFRHTMADTMERLNSTFSWITDGEARGLEIRFNMLLDEWNKDLQPRIALRKAQETTSSLSKGLQAIRAEKQDASSGQTLSDRAHAYEEAMKAAKERREQEAAAKDIGLPAGAPDLKRSAASHAPEDKPPGKDGDKPSAFSGVGLGIGVGVGAVVLLTLLLRR